jgi:predicted transcriptional regulator YdeE
VELEEIFIAKPTTVIGIRQQVSNDRVDLIAALWSEFGRRNLQHMLPNRLGDDVIALYSDYASDDTAPYNLLLGYAVPPGTAVPRTLATGRTTPGWYRRVRTRGSQPQALIEGWTRVIQSKLDRTFVTDYEVHSSRNRECVEIFVGTTRSYS